MITRGAGAIGAAGGYAMAQAFLEIEKETGYGSTDFFKNAGEACLRIETTRPTARNLFYATEKVAEAGKISVQAAVEEAQRLAQENVDAALAIANAGKVLIKDGSRILTHCNAGWLGFVDWGSALAPVYMAHREGKTLHVYADETRPRSQGARLTAWELSNEGIPHTIVPDNAGAYLMSQGLVDMVIVGADRIATNGDTANKIGTFEKAIVAKEFGVPFYVAAPFSTVDLSIPDGSHIIIEERSAAEVLWQEGPDENGAMHRIRVSSLGSHALNPAFDVTPASYITGYITERGILQPEGLSKMN
jgi:S-methyl-5-thioribose-1-phosphate isomerase